ncbi:MAG: 3-dehydroquinate synthase [Cyclobacteriaceae bacterium]|nr:3-dehydroquinate synthase [Cyclobacteriaceae bacterium]
MFTLPDYIQLTEDPSETLNQLVRQLSPDTVGIIVDENTARHCLPKFTPDFPYFLIEIHSGEKEKNLATCDLIWQELTRQNCTRKSLVINLGGGVIGDMGGFSAATFKRGIRFINIPTTLLSQVDASIGGKLGVDFHGLKNHIGVFQLPDKVLIWEGFLETLPARELRSGFAEVIKHGLIRDKHYWNALLEKDFPDNIDWKPIIRKSVELKNDVVQEDPTEKGLRKILNFGHTLGHGIETWYLNSGRDILHGEAIAAGMILESHLSMQKGLLRADELEEITAYILGIYPGLSEFPPEEELYGLLAQDKKNEGKTILFSLIRGIGDCAFDITVENKEIRQALAYYRAIK